MSARIAPGAPREGRRRVSTAEVSAAAPVLRAARPSTGAQPDRITGVAVAVVAGALVAAACPRLPPWLPLAASLIAALFVLRRARTDPARALPALLLTASALSTAWALLRTERIAPDDVRMRLGILPDTAPPDRGAPGAAAGVGIAWLQGTIVTPPVARSRRADRLVPSERPQRMIRFDLDVHAVQTGDAPPQAARGRILVLLDAPPAVALHPGDSIRVAGRFLAPQAPANPGARDGRRAVHSAGIAGTLLVPDPGLIHRCAGGRGPAAALRAIRGAVRQAAEATLERVSRDDPRVRGLLRALLIGTVDPDAADTIDAVRRIGLAHLLAISGLHLGIVIGAVLFPLRLRGRPGRAAGLLVLLTTAAYMLLVEARVPVVRSAVMAAVAALGALSSRQWRMRGLLSLGAIIIVAWRPDQVTEAGFQLSFTVVAALLHLVQPVRRRLHRLGGPLPWGWRGWLESAIVVSVVAWVVSIPIVAAHFGIVSPGAVPLSVTALPFVAALLVLGYLALLAGLAATWTGIPVLTVSADAIGVPARMLATACADVAGIIDAIPGASIDVAPPPPALALALLLAGWAILDGRYRVSRTWTLVGAVLYVTVLLRSPSLLPGAAPPALAGDPRFPLRLDTLSVGNGSCHLVRAGGAALLFDAGSGSTPDIGRRTIVPALRALGVRRLDVLVISHADLDHFSAVAEVLDAVAVDRVIVPAWFDLDAGRKGGAAARLLAHLESLERRPGVMHAGMTLSLGPAIVRAVHPDPDRPPARSNDGSLALHIDAGCGSILLTGDLEQAGITDLLARSGSLRADVLELPHHGADQPATRDLLSAVRPRVVVQSTGAGRLGRDAWADLDGTTRRFVTARDGTVSIGFCEDGRILVRTWRPRAAGAAGR